MPILERRAPFAVRRLRILVLLALTLGLLAFAATMLTLVDRLSDRFGPQVRADLEWRALRGASDLSHSAELGIAMSDAALVLEAFGEYTTSSDIRGLVAYNAAGEIVAQHGDVSVVPALLSGRPNSIVSGAGYVASWAPVQIEGAVVGKVGVIVATQRLTDTHEILARVSRTTLGAGLMVFVFGVVFLINLTRAVAVRDAALRDHALELTLRVADRTRELDQRNQGMRLVLDNVAQGFLTIDLNGVMANEHSAVIDKWFGTPTSGVTLSAFMRDLAPALATWFDLGLQMLADGLMPVDVCLAQLPQRFRASGRDFTIGYSPITTGVKLERILVIISDVTEHLAREESEREQRELVSVFQRISGDRAAGEELLREGATLVDVLATASDRVTEDRVLHTLKGSCGLFGFQRFADLCHAIEGELAECEAPDLTGPQRQRILTGWQCVVRTMERLLGGRTRDLIELDRRELSALIARAREHATLEEIEQTLVEWQDEPVVRRFERLGQQAVALAQRLGKGDIEIDVSGGMIRLEQERWAPLWIVLAHAVRNAVDHGLEAHDVRQRSGKGPARISFAANRLKSTFSMSITDNGRGVNWDDVRTSAARAGLPHQTQEQLVAALFADGLSTRSEADETSGRGVGLAALRSVVVSLGGTIDVLSEPMRGTRFEFRFPFQDARRSA